MPRQCPQGSAAITQETREIGPEINGCWGGVILVLARHPSKQETLKQCWLNVGPSSPTLGQHSINIGSASRVGYATVVSATGLQAKVNTCITTDLESESVNITLRRFLHNHGNLATEKKLEGEIMPYSFRIISRVLYSAQYHRQHCTRQDFPQFETLSIQNPDDKYPTRPGFDSSTSEFRDTTDPMSHRGHSNWKVLGYYCDQHFNNTKLKFNACWCAWQG